MAEPKVRFKRDDGSSYPAWTSGKLGDITEKVDRKAPKGSTAPVMMVSQGNGFVYQADKYSRENAGQSLKNYTLLKQGEFAYNHGASKAKPYGVAYCLTEEPEARVPFVYHTFKISDGVNPYWHEALNTSKMDRQLKRMVSSGARMDGLLNINYDTYMDVDVNIPCEEEQQKIADFLSSVDEVITASEEEVANLETQKKTVMKRIFSQEVRFKMADGSDFPEWEEHPLSYYLEIRDEKQTPTAEAPLMAFIAYKGVADKGDRYDRSFLVKTDDKKYKRTEFNDFIYSSNNLDVGSIGLNKYGSAVISVVYEIFKVKDTAVPECINEIIQAPANMAKILQYRQGALYGQYKIHASDFLSVSVSTPCLEEQRLIADFLSDFDEAISAAKKELELWKELKKGLLQQMFV